MAHRAVLSRGIRCRLGTTCQNDDALVIERVRLGPLVACLAFHSPGLLAKTAATVDEISAGRLVLGVGAGWNRAEFDAFGIPFDHRASRFEESFEIARRLLSGERVTMRGRYWRVEDTVLLPRRARGPTLMVGSTGERVLAATVPHVDAWNTWYDRCDNTPEGFAALNERVTEAVKRAGRAPEEVERSVCVLVVLDRDAGERPNDESAPPLEGPMDRIATRLREFAEAGADEAILVVSPITERSVRSLRGALTLLDGRA